MTRHANVVILTGAGISAESGLGTFRDKDGLWTKFEPYKLATPDAFKEDPGRVHAFYNMRRAGVAGAIPNAAHQALARWEAADRAAGDGDFLLVTQNIDDLHERAGSPSPLHMHGELGKSRCAHCGDIRPCPNDLTTAMTCPACGVAGGLRPHVVWFGEVPFGLDRIGAALDACDLFVAVGTSGTVYPAAGFVRHVAALGRARTVEINLEPSDGHSLFNERIYGAATETVPRFVNEMILRP